MPLLSGSSPKTVSTNIREFHLQLLAVIALALIVVGLIIGYLKPGPVTGLALPAGLTLWILLGHLARKADSQ